MNNEEHGTSYWEEWARLRKEEMLRKVNTSYWENKIESFKSQLARLMMIRQFHNGTYKIPTIDIAIRHVTRQLERAETRKDAS